MSVNSWAMFFAGLLIGLLFGLYAERSSVKKWKRKASAEIGPYIYEMMKWHRSLKP